MKISVIGLGMYSLAISKMLAKKDNNKIVIWTENDTRFEEYKEILYNSLKKALLQENLLFNKRDDIIIKLAKLKNDAGIIGATLI